MSEEQSNVQPQPAPEVPDSPEQVVPLEESEPQEPEHGEYDENDGAEPDFDAEEDES